MGDLNVPEEYSEWPFEARRFVLAEANTATDLRRAINNIVGLENGNLSSGNAPRFDKGELAAVLMALGGPDDE